MLRVILVPAPPDVASAAKDTVLMKVLLRTLSITSLRISIASVTLVVVVKFLYAPLVTRSVSEGDESTISMPLLTVLASDSSLYFAKRWPPANTPSCIRNVS